MEMEKKKMMNNKRGGGWRAGGGGRGEGGAAAAANLADLLGNPVAHMVVNSPSWGQLVHRGRSLAGSRPGADS